MDRYICGEKRALVKDTSDDIYKGARYPGKERYNSLDGGKLMQNLYPGTLKPMALG